MLGLSAGAVGAAAGLAGLAQAAGAVLWPAWGSSAPEAWQVGFLPHGPQAGSAVER